MLGDIGVISENAFTHIFRVCVVVLLGRVVPVQLYTCSISKMWMLRHNEGIANRILFGWF